MIDLSLSDATTSEHLFRHFLSSRKRHSEPESWHLCTSMHGCPVDSFVAAHFVTTVPAPNSDGANMRDYYSAYVIRGPGLFVRTSMAFWLMHHPYMYHVFIFLPPREECTVGSWWSWLSSQAPV